MKTFFALCVLTLCSMVSAQGKYRAGQYPVNQNPADYTIKVHILATHFRGCAWDAGPDFCIDEMYADATLNGKKFEIYGVVDKHQTPLIIPGDFTATLSKKPFDGGKPILGQAYYVLLPDRSAWPCSITGLSE
jgi:hypothetical protein